MTEEAYESLVALGKRSHGDKWFEVLHEQQRNLAPYMNNELACLKVLVDPFQYIERPSVATELHKRPIRIAGTLRRLLYRYTANFKPGNNPANSTVEPADIEAIVIEALNANGFGKYLRSTTE